MCAGMVECVVILPPLHPARYSVPRPARQTKSAGFDICRNKLERARGGRRTLQRTVGQHCTGDITVGQHWGERPDIAYLSESVVSILLRKLVLSRIVTKCLRAASQRSQALYNARSLLVSRAPAGYTAHSILGK